MKERSHINAQFLIRALTAEGNLNNHIDRIHEGSNNHGFINYGILNYGSFSNYLSQYL